MVAPTGNGKSLVQQLAHVAVESASVPNPIVIHVGPLVALANGQLKDMKSYGFSAKYVTPLNIDSKVKSGVYRNIYVSPETLFDPRFLAVLLTPVYSNRVRLICIDEVDCITWQSFRDLWGQIGNSSLLY